LQHAFLFFFFTIFPFPPFFSVNLRFLALWTPLPDVNSFLAPPLHLIFFSVARFLSWQRARFPLFSHAPLVFAPPRSFLGKASFSRGEDAFFPLLFFPAQEDLLSPPPPPSARPFSLADLLVRPSAPDPPFRKPHAFFRCCSPGDPLFAVLSSAVFSIEVFRFSGFSPFSSFLVVFFPESFRSPGFDLRSL